MKEAYRLGLLKAVAKCEFPFFSVTCFRFIGDAPTPSGLAACQNQDASTCSLPICCISRVAIAPLGIEKRQYV